MYNVPRARSNSSRSSAGSCSKTSSLIMVLRKRGMNCFSSSEREVESSTSASMSRSPWVYRYSVLRARWILVSSREMLLSKMSCCMNGPSCGPNCINFCWESPKAAIRLVCSFCNCMTVCCNSVRLEMARRIYSGILWYLNSLGKRFLRSSLYLLDIATVLVLMYCVKRVKIFLTSSMLMLLISICCLSLAISAWMSNSGSFLGWGWTASWLPSSS